MALAQRDSGGVADKYMIIYGGEDGRKQSVRKTDAWEFFLSSRLPDTSGDQ